MLIYFDCITHPQLRTSIVFIVPPHTEHSRMYIYIVTEHRLSTGFGIGKAAYKLEEKDSRPVC